MVKADGYPSSLYSLPAVVALIGVLTAYWIGLTILPKLVPSLRRKGREGKGMEGTFPIFNRPSLSWSDSMIENIYTLLSIIHASLILLNWNLSKTGHMIKQSLVPSMERSRLFQKAQKYKAQNTKTQTQNQQ